MTDQILQPTSCHASPCYNGNGWDKYIGILQFSAQQRGKLQQSLTHMSSISTELSFVNRYRAWIKYQHTHGSD